MDRYHKRKLIQWVNENFGNQQGVPYNNTTASAQNTSTMNSNANHTPTNSLPFTNNVQDIAGEELKNKFRGLNSLKELKGLVDDYLNDIKTATSDALSKEAVGSSYTKLLDLMQKPEILSAIEHIKQELELKKQGMEKPS